VKHVTIQANDLRAVVEEAGCCSTAGRRKTLAGKRAGSKFPTAKCRGWRPWHPVRGADAILNRAALVRRGVMVLACAERPAAASDERAFDQNRQDQGSAVAADRRGDQASRALADKTAARAAPTHLDGPRGAQRGRPPMTATKKNLVAVACHRVGVALDEGPRIRHRNRLTVPTFRHHGASRQPTLSATR
jgi:hypothetical protein